MTLAQSQQDGVCLRYPENVGIHREISYDTAVNMLIRGAQVSTSVPFQWSYIDKPQEGQAYLLFLPSQGAFPVDGIRYQESEMRFVFPIHGRELEVYETRYGFIPGSGETTAWRARRRFRLQKGGHPSLVLVHYFRGPSTPVQPAIMNQPVRSYPLRIVNEPAVFVSGDKVGQKIIPSGGGPPGAGTMGPVPGAPMGINQQQAMLAQQNSIMREREREAQRARDRSGGPAMRPRPEEEDSGDETDLISTRTLALARYRRNHDLMNEVFSVAAFGDKHAPPRKSPYSIFNKSELEEKATKLEAEIEALREKAMERKARRESLGADFGDITMPPDQIAVA